MGSPSTLREEVREVYSAVASDPQGGGPVPCGRPLAANLGYTADLLDALPAQAVEAFCGVSNVSMWADIPVGSVVLDLGCGAGLDTLIAARRTGRTGMVNGVDFSAAMLKRAGWAVAEAGARNVVLRSGDAERIPVDDASIDVTLINGIFNLNLAREAIFRELARVTRPGGAVFASEIVLNEPLPAAQLQQASNWFQ